jgi:hypothetical protein
VDDLVKLQHKCNEEPARGYGDKYHFGGVGDRRAGQHKKQQRYACGEEEYPERVKGARKFTV